MATNANTMEVTQLPLASPNEFSWLQKYVLRRLHPRSILIDLVGLIWFAYFFWYHDWRMALTSVIFFRAVAIMTTMNIDVEAFSKSKWGKIALLHLNPFNMVTQLFGIVVLLYGIWQHSTELILGGISILLFGHVVGWSTVDQALADRN